jgi:phospholipase/carboxylesterase
MLQFKPLKLGALNTLYAYHDEKKYLGPRRVMVVLPGLGDVKESYQDFAKEMNLSGLDFLLVDGVHPYPVGKAWYWPERPHLRDQMIDQSIEALAEGLKMLPEHFKTLYPGHELDMSSMIFMGFSAGAATALELGFKMANSGTPPLATIACSPRVFNQRLEKYHGPKQKISFELTIHHGKYDPVINFEETKSNLEDLGLQDYLRAYPIEHTISYDQVVFLREWLNNIL